MLVLSRKAGEEILIGDNIRLTVLAIRGNQIRLGLTAPTGVHVYRSELTTPDKQFEPSTDRPDGRRAIDRNDPAHETPPAPPNPAQMAELETRVQARLNRRIRDFQLLIRGNGLVLRGYAPTYYAKQLAQLAVVEATAFPVLVNEIQVR